MTGSTRNPSGLAQPGTGLNITRMCSKCSTPKQALGGGLRQLFGFRQWVCMACKEKIDAKRSVKTSRTSP